MMILRNSAGRCITLLLLTALSACSENSSDQPGEAVRRIEIGSSGAVFEVAEHALPNGVSIDEIRVEPLGGEEAQRLIENATLADSAKLKSAGGYNLIPDGIEFSEPATLTVPIGDALPTFFEVHAGDIQPVADVVYELSSERRVAVVPVRRFSFIVHGNADGQFWLNAQAADTHPDERVRARVDLTFNPLGKYETGNLYAYDHEPIQVYISGPGALILEPAFEGGKNSQGVDPLGSEIVDLKKGHVYETNSFIRCLSEGAANVHFNAWIRYYVRLKPDRKSDPHEITTKLNIVIPFECLSEEKEHEEVPVSLPRPSAPVAPPEEVLPPYFCEAGICWCVGDGGQDCREMFASGRCSPIEEAPFRTCDADHRNCSCIEADTAEGFSR